MTLLRRVFGGWKGERAMEVAVGAVVATAFAEPGAEDVAWLASVSSDGDVDHALWELRYLRRALTLHVVRLCSLDDRTHSLAASKLESALSADVHVDAGKRGLAIRQFNTRLTDYGAALLSRDFQPVTERVGRLLLSYAGASSPDRSAVGRAAALAATIMDETNTNMALWLGEPSGLEK